MSTTVEILDREYTTYNNHRLELLASAQGKYAVVSGDTILGVWDTYVDALKAGYEACGVDQPFLVQQIQRHDPVQVVYRGKS